MTTRPPDPTTTGSVVRGIFIVTMAVIVVGARRTVVAAHGGREVCRETLARTELAARNWTITIPADASDALEQQAGFQ